MNQVKSIKYNKARHIELLARKDELRCRKNKSLGQENESLELDV